MSSLATLAVRGWQDEKVDMGMDKGIPEPVVEPCTHPCWDEMQILSLEHGLDAGDGVQHLEAGTQAGL